MSTGVIIALIVVGVVIVLAAGAFAARTTPRGGRGLRRRFGPEYERTVARHNGDTRAAEQELAERVKRHGALRTQPLDPVARERYLTRWADAQERFVESPDVAVAEADMVIADLARERGFPDGGNHDEQFDALSVHHGPHVHGYRRVHRAAHPRADEGQAGTEELREAMLEARPLFDELVGPDRATPRGTTTAPKNDHRDKRNGVFKGRLAKGS
ncbi:hypothetical protein [Streptomyces sp. WG-D5]